MQKLDEYQEQALRTLNVPEPLVLNYLGFGLTSEAGEVAGKIKKMIRSEIAERNISKLKDRFDRGVICGDGDKR